MIKNKLKGRIEFNTIVIFLILSIVFVVALTFFFKIWNIGMPSITNTGSIHSECSKWQIENCNETLDAIEKGKLKYPTLKEKFGTNLDQAKKFCNCPG